MMQLKVRKKGQEKARRRRGFTLAQVLVSIAIIGAMAGSSTVLAKTYTRTRLVARHNECDAHLMNVIGAIDTFRQDNRRMPYSLAELVKRRYIEPEMLRCPSDPHLAEHSNDPTYTSYGNSYVIRDVMDSDQLPMIVCPFHDDDGGSGEQAYKSFYTKRFRVRSATLAAGDWAGAVTVTRGSRVLTLPEAGQPPLDLQGGDHFSLGAGRAKIYFADTSFANMDPNTELTVLQSFVQNQQRGTLYTVVHQALGTVHYYVNPGSNFDVSTPTATAGALGTYFTVTVRPVAATVSYPYDTVTDLDVTEHKVAFTSLGKTVLVTDADPQIEAGSPNFPAGSVAFQNKPRRPRPAPQEGLSIPVSTTPGGTTTNGTTTSGTTTSGTTTSGTTTSGTTTSGTTTSGTTTSGTTTSGTTTSGTTTSGATTSGTTTSGTTTSGTTTNGGTTTSGTTTSGTTTSGVTTSGTTTSGTTTSGTTTSGTTTGGSDDNGGSNGNSNGNGGSNGSSTSGSSTSGSSTSGSSTSGSSTSGSSTSGSSTSGSSTSGSSTSGSTTSGSTTGGNDDDDDNGGNSGHGHNHGGGNLITIIIHLLFGG